MNGETVKSEASRKPITVMYVIDTYLSKPGSPPKGGAERQLELLVNSLNGGLFKSIVVQLFPITSHPIMTGGNEHIRFVHLPIVRFYTISGLLQILKLARMARREKVDVIQSFFEKSEVVGWLVSKLSGVCVWMTSRRDLGFKRKRVYDRIFSYTAKDCSVCVANCRAVRDHVIKHEQLLPEHTEVIYNGLDLDLSGRGERSQDIRNELGISPAVALVGMVANLDYEIKGHQYFIEAAKYVLERNADVAFVLVGDGVLRERYERMVQGLGIGEKVYFLGKRKDIASLISGLDISVLCSTSEGLSNVVLESMAAGKPVVVSRVGGNPEMVIDGVTGYVVPPADSTALGKAILVLVTEPDRASAMGAAGRKRVEEQFSVEAMVKGYEKVYRSLVQRLN